MPLSFPILAIPLYYCLATYPHGHAILVSTKNNLGWHDNRNPKSSSLRDNVKSSLSPRDFAKWERCESCHRNHLENMPLFAAVVFAGLFAQSRAGADVVGLERFCVGWLAVRVLYTVNYIYTETQEWSYLRSALYFLGTGWAFLVLWRAAWVLGN